jgi:hypothetical protein
VQEPAQIRSLSPKVHYYLYTPSHIYFMSGNGWIDYNNSLNFSALNIFMHACNFDLLVLFPNIQTLPLLQRTYPLSFMLCLCPAFWCDIKIYLVLFGFTSRPSSSLPSNRAFVCVCVCVCGFLHGMYVLCDYFNVSSKGKKLMCPIQYQSFLVLLTFPVAYSKQSWKAVVFLSWYSAK